MTHIATIPVTALDRVYGGLTFQQILAAVVGETPSCKATMYTPFPVCIPRDPPPAH